MQGQGRAGRKLRHRSNSNLPESATIQQTRPEAIHSKSRLRPAGRASEGLGSAVGHCSRSDWEALRPAGRFGPTGRQPACSMTGGHRFGAEFSVRSVEINFKLPRKDDETKAPARPGLSHGIVRWSGSDTDELRK